MFNLESVSKQSKTIENKFHSFSSQFPTEKKFGISLVVLDAIQSVLFSRERFTWSIISDILYLSIVAAPLKLSERKMTRLNWEKCDLSFTPVAGICTKSLWLC